MASRKSADKKERRERLPFYAINLDVPTDGDLRASKVKPLYVDANNIWYFPREAGVARRRAKQGEADESAADNEGSVKRIIPHPFSSDQRVGDVLLWYRCPANYGGERPTNESKDIMLYEFDHAHKRQAGHDPLAERDFRLHDRPKRMMKVLFNKHGLRGSQIGALLVQIKSL